MTEICSPPSDGFGLHYLEQQWERRGEGKGGEGKRGKKRGGAGRGGRNDSPIFNISIHGVYLSVS